MKCPDCPAPANDPCVGECPEGLAFCEMALKDETWRAHVVGRSRFPCPGTSYDPTQTLVATATPTSPEVATWIQLSRRAAGCPHRSKPENCGCQHGQALCLAGRSPWTDGKVTIRDCVDCLQKLEESGEPWPPIVDPALPAAAASPEPIAAPPAPPAPAPDPQPDPALPAHQQAYKSARSCPHRSLAPNHDPRRVLAVCKAGRSPRTDQTVSMKNCLDCYLRIEAAGEPWPPVLREPIPA